MFIIIYLQRTCTVSFDSLHPSSLLLVFCLLKLSYSLSTALLRIVYDHDAIVDSVVGAAQHEIKITISELY